MSALPLLLGVGGVAVAAGMVSIPAARRFVFGSVHHDWLAGELDLDRIDPDGFTVRCKSGSVLRVYRIGGQSYDTKPEGEQFALHERRAAFIHECANSTVSLRFFGVKRRRAAIEPATWPSPALQEIGDAEATLYRNAFELRWYLVLQAKSMDQLEKADERIRSLLPGYRPTRLQRPEASDTPCPLTGFLNFLTCGDLRDDLPAISSNISANLPASDLVYDRDGTFVAHLPTPVYHRIIAVREWPELVSGYLLHELMALPGEIEVSQVVLPISKERAILLLKQQSSGQFVPAKKAEECSAVINLLEEGKTSLMATQLAVVVRGGSQAAADNLAAEVARILANRRVIYSVETKGTPVVWFNRLPDHDHLLRPLKPQSEAIAALWPFESAPTGLSESHYGPAPVRSFSTGSGQAFAFQFHSSAAPNALGHYLVFAPSNSGKTTSLMHLLGGLTKFDGVRSYIFDSNEGTRFMVEVMGGLYQSFDRLALNPFDTDDTAINRQRLSLLIRLMLGEAGQVDGIEDLLAHVVDTAFKLPVEERSFNSIFPLVFPRRTDVRRVFSRWVTDEKGREGLYASNFNAPRDTLGGLLNSAYMVGINMNEALADASLGAPIVAHIANAIERIARSGQIKGFNIFIDEAANLLRNPAFRDLAAVMFREYRKLGGSVGMAFQDLGALHKSGIADAVIENAATFLFFPNPQGNRDAYEPFNLNDEQKAFIFGAPEGRKVLLVKRDASTGRDESVILDIDLEPLGDALRFYRSGPDAVRELLAIQAKWGEQWPDHV